MPLSDVVAAALSRPLGHVVEVPVRELVEQVLRDKGFAAPDEVATVADEARELGRVVRALEARLAQAESEAQGLRERLDRMESEARAHAAAAAAASAEVARLQASAPESPPVATTVGPKGEVDVDGVAYRIDPAHAGRAYVVSGRKQRRVYIDGRAVRKQRA